MVSARVLRLLGLACISSAFSVVVVAASPSPPPPTSDHHQRLPSVQASDIQEPKNHLVTTPSNAVLEIGTNFTAMCVIVDTEVATADDLYWNLSKTVIPREHYTKINRTALNVTIPITHETPQWLFCRCKKVSPYIYLNQGKFVHGIYLKAGYYPVKPENLSCIALQEKDQISSVLSCKWDAAAQQTETVPITYTLSVKQTMSNELHNASTHENKAQVRIGGTFPSFMPLDIWVEAQNALGTVESEHLRNTANFYIKTNPPSDVAVISEQSFPTSLLITWSHPIEAEYLKLKYQVRYCPHGSHVWTDVPQADTSKYITSFRLQGLRPYTVYDVQVRCKDEENNSGHWSDWSANATKRTPEDSPSSKPGLWVTTVNSGLNERKLQLFFKVPEFANGRITGFDVSIQNLSDQGKNRSLDWKSIPVNRSEDQRVITPYKMFSLADTQSVKVRVVAVNSVGRSPEAFLVIPSKSSEKKPPVEELKVWPQDGQLWLEWKPPQNKVYSEYVIEWVSDGNVDWQREKKTVQCTAIRGNLEPFVCYNVSVYPIYSGRIGKSAHVEAFLKQGAPLDGPFVNMKGNPRHDSAELEWEEIPQHRRRGFITNYTIYYKSGTDVKTITVPANTTSYTLKSLLRDTKYDVWIEASTISGSKTGDHHSFTTLKYGPGMIESIVVLVSLGFFTLFLLCVYKRDVIKKNFWPQIPNPGESTIGNWSPDCSSKSEPPSENCLTGISVLDVCDPRRGFEEDKTSLSLKKDKYLSEEHSSGIGGSSCMSSPRQSVSDSDEGADMADTSASTVQYSSVVASRGYKGQTPSSQPQHCIFSRSESTQPLLDSEENPDMFVQEGNRHFQRFPGPSCFTHSTEDQAATDPDDFKQLEMEQQDLSSIEEDTEQAALPDRSADVPPAGPVSSYMPQLGGYRPQ